MAVNQPIIDDNQADNSWKLEVTNQINSEEARLNALLLRIEQLESGGTGGTGGGGQTGTLQLTNYVQLVQPNQLNYTFTGAANLSSVPHQVFIGGQKLIETVDYNVSNIVNGMITLTNQPDLSNNPTNPVNQLMIELSVWSL